MRARPVSGHPPLLDRDRRLRAGVWRLLVETALEGLLLPFRLLVSGLAAPWRRRRLRRALTGGGDLATVADRGNDDADGVQKGP